MPSAFGTCVLMKRIGAALFAFAEEPDQCRLLPLEGEGALMFGPLLLGVLDYLV